MEAPNGNDETTGAVELYCIELAVRLFEERAITQGDGALIARMSRSEFIDILLERGVSPIQVEAEEI